MGKKIFKLLEIAKRGLLDIIYDRESSCILCNKSDSLNVICDTCMKNIVRCPTQDIAYGYYKGELKKLILKFKYQRDFNAGKLLSEFLMEKIENKYEDYYIVYIPITKESCKLRGFNQCEYLAREIEFFKGNKFLNILSRDEKTMIQKNLSKSERIKNMKNAFFIKKKGISLGKKILLIDDVVTTGATLEEAKRVLINDGAEKVEFLVVAKGDY